MSDRLSLEFNLDPEVGVDLVEKQLADAGLAPTPFVAQVCGESHSIPCSCGHDYKKHGRGFRCCGPDSYGIACTCPSYEADENIVADLIADGWIKE